MSAAAEITAATDKLTVTDDQSKTKDAIADGSPPAADIPVTSDPVASPPDSAAATPDATTKSAVLASSANPNNTTAKTPSAADNQPAASNCAATPGPATDEEVVTADATAANPPKETEHEEIPTSGPLLELNKLLPACVADARYNEMWGVDITNIRDPPCCIVLQKFLKANGNDPTKAAEQLTQALKWRKTFQPLEAVKELHDREKFEGLGYLTQYGPQEDVGDETPEKVFTWNIYGGVKDRKNTFGNIDEFCRWRVALMEMGAQRLNLNSATAPLPPDGTDTYRMIQVHDYLDVSFLRLDPDIKAASKNVISIFQTAYPELLEHKYFVNVPYVMNWIFNFFKLFLAEETVAKFHPLAKGTMLGGEFKEFWEKLPGCYGGRQGDLKDNPQAVSPLLAEKVVKEEAAEVAAEGTAEGEVKAGDEATKTTDGDGVDKTATDS